MTEPKPMPAGTPVDTAATEARIRTALENLDGQDKALLAAIDSLGQAGLEETAIELAARLQEQLVKKGDEALVLDYAEWLVRRKHGEPGIRNACEQFLAACFDARRDPTGSVLVRECGFSSAQDVPLPEAIRRVRLLRKLAPGVLCYEKTWGLGVILDVDALNKKVRIDFEKRKGHRLSLAYAAETLRLLDENHLLSRWHRDPEGLARMIRETPGEVVRLALEGFGPMPAAALQACLVDRMIQPSDWKTFWDAARKELKKQGIVDIPARRSEEIRISEKRASFGSDWFAMLAEERDMPGILSQVESLLRDAAPGSLDDRARAVLADRLEFVVVGAGMRKPDLAGRAILALDAIGIPASEQTSEWIKANMHPSALKKLLLDLPARSVGGILDLLGRRDAGALTSALLENSNHLPLSILNSALDHLKKSGQISEMLARMKSDFAFCEASPAVLLWFARNMDFAMREGLAQPDTLVENVLRALERRDLKGDQLRMKNALRDHVEQHAWMVGAFERMAENRRGEVIMRLNATDAWSPAKRRLIADAIVERFPDLKENVRKKAAAEAAPAYRFTSFRSLRERQAQLQKIVQEDIPKNSEDIAHARGYGDLRENFEYKAAREAQDLLMRRRSELEHLLSHLRGTDFAGIGADAAAPGTTVRIRHSDGSETLHHILGELDSDEKMGVISSLSSLAKALIGRRAGEAATIPAAAGEDACKIIEVSTIPEEIKIWARG